MSQDVSYSRDHRSIGRLFSENHRKSHLYSLLITPRYFEKCTDVCQPNYMVGAPCICMAEPGASKMSSSAYNVPHTKYMWTSTWPGLAGFGVLSADSVHARPPYSTCRPGHLPRGSVPPGVPDEAVLLSKAPGGSPYILYGR